MGGSPANLAQILRLEVPVVVRLGERQMSVREVLGMMPGTIVEVPKDAESELDLLVNNKVIGCGSAVKVGENFGIRINFVGDLKTRVKALAPAPAPEPAEADPAALAEALLAGQA